MTAAYSLRFGDMDFSPQAQLEDVEFQVLGISRGEVVPVTVVADSMMRDGADERIDHWENRDQSLLIGIKAADSDLQATAEHDLWLECQKPRNELAWTPPDGYGETTVFDVLWAGLKFRDDTDSWDLDELRGFRVWQLTPRVLPFGHSDTEVIDDGLVAGGTPVTTVISDGTSATGWTSPYGSVTVSSGQLLLQGGPATSTYVDSFGNTHFTIPYEATAPALGGVDFSATPYLTLEVSTVDSTQYPPTPPQVFVDSVELTLLASVALSATSVRATYLCNDASASTLRVHGVTEAASLSTVQPALADMLLDNVSRSNRPPALATTGRESVRTVRGRGSARTMGRISVSHATAALGDVLLFSCPALSTGYTPDLRRWRSAGGTVTADGNTVSGSRQVVAGTVFTVPAAPLPRGTYLMYGRVRASADTTAVIQATAKTIIGSTPFGTQATNSDSTALLAGVWKIVPIGELTLPTVDVPSGASGSVEITLSLPTGTDVEWDEMWIFYAGEDSALTIAHCGSGSPTLGANHNRLWLDSPSLDRPEPAIFMGTLADRSDAFFADVDGLVDGWGLHPILPTDMTFFLATTGATNAALQVARKPAWHTHAARLV